MSVFRKPKGQYVRNTGDWFFERAMGGSVTTVASVGQLSTASLYNDATDGSILHVIALEVFCATASTYGLFLRFALA